MSPNQVLDCFQVMITCFFIFYTFYKILGNKKHTFSSTIVLSIVQAVTYYLVCYSPTIEKLITIEIRMVLKTIFSISFFCIFAFFFCGSTVAKRLQAIFVVLTSILLFESVQVIFYPTLLNVSASEIRDLDFKMRLIVGSIAVFFYFLACVLAYFICKRKELKLTLKTIVLFTTIFLSLAFMITLISVNLSEKNNLFTTITLAFSCITISIVIVLFYKLLIKLNQQELLKEKLFWTENVQKFQLDYYNKIKEKTDAIRQIRHDFKDQLESINRLIKENTSESSNLATDMLNELNNKIEATHLPIYTQNLIVNTVVGIKVEEHTHNEIKWDIKLDLPETIESIEAIDLNCLFINLLNNSIDACLKANTNERKIILHANMKSNYLIIKLENTFTELITDAQGKLLTTKADKELHGVGTILIENIVKKYNGNYEFEVNKNTFKNIVTIKC